MRFDRITVRPELMQGKPCVRGMRIQVSLVVNLTANGMSPDEIIAECPDLEKQDIRQCLQYAAWLTEDRVMPDHEPAIEVPG